MSREEGQPKRYVGDKIKEDASKFRQLLGGNRVNEINSFCAHLCKSEFYFGVAFAGHSLHVRLQEHGRQRIADPG